ncbi:PepSY-associated TM helix domain-containing protein [Marilutibacter chinensis]|uniref:PepSY domain-containing protein n=1 Tax=Marilutibacter chinensis TaxID=2912247 RepID=A0ABS9HV33_9GAMM|nr:PepSY-associated TM helix domain-containing protein [Lysobacter chinensis]MCF7222568.1 PepSY domain-containing protein [Lysobacter chinensis]
MSGIHPARDLQRRLRAALSWLHLWFGLVLGSVFALVALAGTVLVFHVELLRLQHPHLTRHAPVARAPVLERIADEWGPRGLRSLDLPREALPVWQGYFADGHRGYFSPVDGSLLLTRSHRDDWLLWLHELHVELLGGKAGKEVLGIVGWIALGLLLSGLYLWWPKRRQWRAHLRFHAGPPTRRWLSWHRSSGVILLPLVLLITLTGVGMIYSNGFRDVLTGLLGGANHAAPVAAPTASPPQWRHVLASAAVALPGARVNRVSVPGDDGVIAFRARAEGEWHPVGRSTIHLARDGEVLQVVDATADPAGTRIHQAIYPLHIGAVGGAAMRWLTALAGLMPAFLLVTGFLFWRRRRGK